MTVSAAPPSFAYGFGIIPHATAIPALHAFVNMTFSTAGSGGPPMPMCRRLPANRHVLASPS